MMAHGAQEAQVAHGGRTQKRPYKEVLVWQRGYEFLLEIYRATEQFPRQEIYGVTSQLRRASVSVVANFVEGYAKRTQKELLRFLDISKGSLAECEFFLELCRDLHYLTQEEYDRLETLRGKTAFLLYRFTLAKRISHEGPIS